MPTYETCFDAELISDEYMSYSDASQYCSNTYGTTLVKIGSQRQQDYVYSLVYGNTGSSSVWIGLNDVTTEGSWAWDEDGSIVYTGGADVSGVYNNWNTNEPNNLGDEDCTEMFVSSGLWNDLDCSTTYAFVCRVPCCDATLNQILFFSFDNDYVSTNNTLIVWDDSENGNNGIGYGNITFIESIRNNRSSYSYDFNGANSYIEVDSKEIDSELQTSDVSVSVWIRTDSNDNAKIISKGGGCSDDCNCTGITIGTANNGSCITLELVSDDSTCLVQLTGTIIINDDRWHHIAATVENGGDASIYIDAELDATTTLTGNYNLSNDRSLMIGTDNGAFSMFEGLIDGVRIYTKQMTDYDVKCIYNVTIPTPMPTNLPSLEPTYLPTGVPTAPTTNPTGAPSVDPTSTPTDMPTQPSTDPTPAPSGDPTSTPTNMPTGPTIVPTKMPTNIPTGVYICANCF